MISLLSYNKISMLFKMAFFTCALGILGIMALTTRPAAAQGIYCYDCSCIFAQHAITQAHIRMEHDTTRKHFGTAEPIPDKPRQQTGTGELGKYQDWLIFEMFYKYIEPALRVVVTEMTAASQHQSVARSSFADSRNQSASQRSMQIGAGEAQVAHQPSPGLCSMATNTQKLNSSDQSGMTVAAYMNRMFLARQLGEPGSSSENGPAYDRAARLEQFRSRYCNKSDNNAVAGKPMTGLGGVCKASVDEKTANRDIDFMRTFMMPLTLELDFSDGQMTDDEQDILAMQNYLYGHDVIRHVPPELAKRDAAKDEILDTRAWIAKMNLAASSFFIIAGMKSQGPEGTLGTMAPIMKQLGVGDDKIIESMLGKRPSYMAQLEVMSKRFYQSPSFYTNLYGAPENTGRYKAAIQSVGNVVEHEISSSQKRSEALLALYLELRNIPKQQSIQSNINEAMK